MTTRMPRGAIPVRRSDLAAAEPYRPDPDTEVFVPSGKFPSPNQELAAAEPYRPVGGAPGCFLGWPIEIGSWGNEDLSNSSWAEEAFAKACAEPRVFISANVVLQAARECGLSNFAEFMQTHGFQMGRKAYLDGAFHAVDWSKEEVLNSAIANAGPVKIGVISPNLVSAAQGQFMPGKSGWAVCSIPPGQTASYCASLCGYGPLAALVDLFEHDWGDVNLPAGMPSGLCYAMFIRSSIGIIDRQSLMNITGEAWVRRPTTIVRDLKEQPPG